MSPGYHAYDNIHGELSLFGIYFKHFKEITENWKI